MEKGFQTITHQVDFCVVGGGLSGICAAIAGHPSPEDAALTIMLHLGDYAGQRFEVGYASAIAVVLTILILGCGRLAFKILGEKE